MIIDQFNNLNKYQQLLPGINNALDLLDELKGEEVIQGEKYFFEGGYLFFQNGVTQSDTEGNFESHKFHTDVQLLRAGEEHIATKSEKADDLVPIPYNSQKDLAEYIGKVDHGIKVSKGYFYVFLPGEIHKAVFHLTEPTSFEKIVIKLEVRI